MGRNRGSDSMSYRACGTKIGLCVKGKGGVRMCENDCQKREQRRLKTLGVWRESLKKRLKRPGAPVGFGWKGCENSPESRRFLPPFHHRNSVRRNRNSTALHPFGVCRTYGKVCLGPSFCYRPHFGCYSPVRTDSPIQR